LAACVALACGALGWLSVTTLRLERAEAQARAEGAVEERVRLALWRMDGRLARLLAQESTRVVSAWESFYVPLHVFAQDGSAPEPSTARIASPLLYGTPEEVRLHFAFKGMGPLRSPQVPVGGQRELALAAGARSEQLQQYGARLAELEARLDRRALLQLETGTPSPETIIAAREPSAIEFNRRQSQAIGNAAYLQLPSEAPPDSLPEAQEVQVSPLVPVWMGDELLLVRRVAREQGGVEVQGAWLDWARIQSLLLAEVTDLLPAAALERVPSGAGDLLERRLASFQELSRSKKRPLAHRSSGASSWHGAHSCWRWSRWGSCCSGPSL
jgi:hypothetical protein